MAKSRNQYMGQLRYLHMLVRSIHGSGGLITIERSRNGAKALRNGECVAESTRRTFGYRSTWDALWSLRVQLECKASRADVRIEDLEFKCTFRV